jgi:hypothetical protein
VGGQSCCERKVVHVETEEETQEHCPDCRGDVWRGDGGEEEEDDDKGEIISPP